jgi:hypothetical protein
MIVLTIQPKPSPQRDLHFMADPSKWEVWPFLPVMRRHSADKTDYGVLFDAQGVCDLTGYRCAVFLTNLFNLPPKLDDLFALPKEVYDTFDELIAAGWHVD